MLILLRWGAGWIRSHLGPWVMKPPKAADFQGSIPGFNSGFEDEEVEEEGFYRIKLIQINFKFVLVGAHLGLLRLRPS